MTDAYIGEIRAFPYRFIPTGWLLCDGTNYAVEEYQALFATIGNIYGGQAGRTFNVPNLQGRVAIGAGQGEAIQPYQLGQTGGTPSVALTEKQIPTHSHEFNIDFEKYSNSPSSFSNTPQNLNAKTEYFPSRYMLPIGSVVTTFVAYSKAMTQKVALGPTSLSDFGLGQPHENRQPYLTLVYCIAYDGTYPWPVTEPVAPG
jgi:microcystin-dependent protein